MMNYRTRLLLFLMIGALLAACGNGKHTPDVAGIPVSLTFQRFDRDLFAVDTNNVKAGLEQLGQKYPDFLPFFATEIAHDQTNPKETPLEAMQGFITASQVRRLNDSCQQQFTDLSKIQKDMTQMLRYYRYYFPDKPQPRVVTAVTEFIGDAVMVNDSLLMIGLDFFMGEKFSGYDPDLFPQYMRRQFTPDCIVLKSAFALANQAVGPPPGEHILDYMINNGKVLYILDHLLPAAPDSMKMNYTQKEITECQANEQNVWARLLEMKVLYDPLGEKNQKIVTPSPKTESVYTEAPGAIGNWIGWQIVKSWMERHPDADFKELIRQHDSQQFLEAAKYKPKRQ